MKKTLFLCLWLTLMWGAQAMAAVSSNVVRVVGGDLSLVPAYEAAGDKWLDANGRNINTYYEDGIITYLRDVAGWTAVRCRLLVDPSQDDYVATCQDLDYVKKLGKRVKDAGMYFLLDIFYSDTWTDVSQQWIPKSWNNTRTTATATVAAKVKSYTTEVLNTLTAYGAQPDYVQIGNEVSYGMLWDSKSGGSMSNAFYTSGSYSTYSTQITRFATILKSAAQGVRAATNGSQMKIVLHSERTSNSTYTKNFYTWVENAGFTDYDVMGLSYYPQWHGAMSNLKSTISTLQNYWSDKEIQIVETGYPASTDATYSSGCNTTGTWAYSFAGQGQFVIDLTSTLNGYTNVTGLYYWQPEECGNGANSSGVKQVMDEWDNRGFWECSWKSGSHTLKGSTALMAVQNFNHTALGETPGEGEDEYTITDISDQFSNLDFEDCTWNDEGEWVDDVPGWTINFDQNWSDGPWGAKTDEWVSSLVDGTYMFKAWNAGGNALSAGNILSQTLGTLPAGTYTVSAVVHCDYDGVYLFANDTQTKVTTTSTWSEAYLTTVETELTEAGTLSIGLKLPSAVNTSSEVNLYLDNFKVVQKVESGTDPIVVVPDSVYWYEGIKYVYRQDGTAYVAGYFGDDLPSEGVDLLGEFTVDGTTYYPSWIAEWSMEEFPLSWITIPSSITVVGQGAFYKSSLSNVTFFTNDYLSIYDYAFTGWDENLDDGNLGSKGSALYNVTIYAESLDHVTVSDKAFHSDDIDEATLWVVRGLLNEQTYGDMGFLHVYPIGAIPGDVNGNGVVDDNDIVPMVNILIGKNTSYILYEADVDGNQEVTLADLTALINKII